MTRMVLVGDLGGQRGTMQSVLEELGVGTDLRLPSELHVLQVGDIIRCSPQLREHNSWVAKTIRSLLLNNPGRWTQLVGNHECAALGGPSRLDWNLEASFTDECRDVLEQLWTEGRMRIASSTQYLDDDSPVLVTHAGLTRARWLDMGQPDTAEAARLLNEWVSMPFDSFSEPGSLVSGELNPLADPLWAEVNLELYEPWVVRGQMPFHQVHGHAGPFNWNAGEWWPDCPPEVRRLTHLDERHRRTTTRVSDETEGYRFHGIDWMLGDEPTDVSWQLPMSRLSPPSPA